MRRPSALPVWTQVAALAVLAVVLSQTAVLAVIVLAPEPQPSGFTAAAAAEAAMGRPAETSDGRRLTRRLSDRPLVESREIDPIAGLIATSMARRLDAPVGSVRVAIERRRPPPGWRRGPGEGRSDFILRGQGTIGAASADGTRRIVVGAAQRTPPSANLAEALGAGRDVQVVTPVSDPMRFSLLTENLPFPPFSASVRLSDGRWATVRPPRDLIDPWQKNLLLALGLSMLLLAPLVWWMARRLTRPIRTFADAAQRLGADPDAEPLRPSGPSEVRTAIDAFNDMQASLRGHVRKRTQTVVAIAHDLRTPLTRLRFRAEQAPEALRDRMAADIEEMDALIGQALAYVRGEQPVERREAFDLADLARDCAQGFAETGAAVSFQADGALPIEADPAALRRALANLIGNAVKYAGAARVHAAIEAGQATVTVEDDGPGLPPDELETVFEPFHRAERSRSRETGGAGLGLTVARQAARAHGGEVSLENRPDGGLTASLVLPLRP